MVRAQYDFLKATFYFFTVIGRRPLSVLWIALWQIIAMAAVLALALISMWPFLQQAFEWVSQSREPSDAEVFALMASIWVGMLLTILASLFYAVVVQGAWLRLIARNEMAAIIPFRFGFDELRLIGVNCLFFVFGMIAYIITVLLFVTLNGVLFAADGGGVIWLQALVNTAFVVVALVGWIIAMLGFASSPALAVRQKGFRFFSGFAASANVKGMMFLSYLVLVVAIIFGAVLVGVFQQVFILFGMADFMAIAPSLDAIETPKDGFAILADMASRPGIVISVAIIVFLQLLYQIFCETAWHGVGAYVAVRHDGEFDQDGAAQDVPVASVGAAPSEG